jgi:neopullulanase
MFFLMKKTIFLLGFLFYCSTCSFCQEEAKVYPTNWWVGMKNPFVQLMIRHQGIGKATGIVVNYPGVKLLGIHKTENANYLFVDLEIAKTTRAGVMEMNVHFASKNERIPFELKERRKGNGVSFARGINSADFIYLIMPDRFSNGDSTNDRIVGMRDQSLDRDSMYLRHGGDIRGIIQHLDYLQNLGVTALWLTPVLENDMPNRTEHGYAFTDHYRIDPRLGGASAYEKLSDELHKRGMKLIQDAVYNHVGLYHFLMQDPPSKDWFHQWPSYTQTNYRDQTQFDPHAAPSDKKQLVDGWFTHQMPDLNQNNPEEADFLIQHAIWCVETFGVDAWRIDTYIYLDLPFMNRCNQALLDEYPRLTMFGEAWVHGTANAAYFVRNNIRGVFESNLIGVTDFQSLFDGIQPALTQPPGGVQQLYQTASNDFLYRDPMNNVIFLDNHDMSRFLSQMDRDIAKDKIGLEWLLTWRGIPEMYYGTEVLMEGISNPDGLVRMDFPGGWLGDKKNAFTGVGLTQNEKDMHAFVTKLANFRKSSSAIKTGKMMQYAPRSGMYVYFRYDSVQTIMCVMNTDSTAKTVDFSKYGERTKGFDRAIEVTGNQIFSIKNAAEIPSRTMWVLELRN